MLNTTDEQQEKHAKEDDIIKRSFELVLLRKILPLFKKYSKEYRDTLSKTGAIPSTIFFLQELEKVLRQHYDKVSRRFSKRVVDKTSTPENHEQILNSIKTRNDIHNQLRALDSADIIAKTTVKDAILAKHKTEREAIAAGIVLAAAQLANRARLKLDRQFAKRIKTISITETQNPAEHAKLSEIIFLVHHNAIKENKMFKGWQTMEDDKVRPMHADANGQIVPFAQPFDVGGQNLMYPGDQSLGATIDNWINCRCVLVPIIT